LHAFVNFAVFVSLRVYSDDISQSFSCRCQWTASSTA